MAWGYIPKIFCSIIFIYNISFLVIKVSAVDEVKISNELLNEEYTDNQEVLVVQSYNHTFVCLATNTGTMVSMKWELHDGNAGRFIDHDNGFPHTLPNSGDSDLTDTLGQVTIAPIFDIPKHNLRCRVEDNINIDRKIILNVQVPPSNSSIKLYDANKPGGYAPGEIIQVTQDESHSLNCVIQATKPESQVSWTTVADNVRTTNAANSDDMRLFDTTSISTFVPAREHHREMVECRAVINVPGIGNIPSPPASIEVQLEVQGPPDKPVITGPTDIIENEMSQLECQANDAYPTGTLHWFLNNIEITDSSAQTDSMNSNGRYNMMSTLTYTMSREQNQQQIRCEAHHETLTSPLQSSDVSINVKFCPTEVSLSNCPTFVVVDGMKTIKLSCISSSSNPQSAITWYLNDDIQESGHSPKYADADYYGETTELDFTSRPLIADDVGVETKCCADIATEDICQTQICSEVCNPDIYFSPVFEDITVPQETKTEGDEVTLSCVVNAMPQPDKFVQWVRDGNTIGGVFDNEAGRLLLHIASVTKEDAGLYMCVADNGFGSDSTEELPLNVLYKPVLIQRNLMGMVVLKRGSRVSLNVTIQSNPQAVITWSSPSGSVPVNGNDAYELDSTAKQDDIRGAVVDSSLVIKASSSTTDVGKFICTATNSKGTLDISFDIDVAAIPSAPSSLKLVSSTSDTLTLEWMSDDQDDDQWFWVTCGDIDAKKHTGQNMAYTATGLESNTLYSCEVYGENDAGVGPSRTVQGITNPSPPDALGIEVKHDLMANEVSILGVPNAGSNLCVQLEITVDIDEQDWNKTGPCHVNDTVQSIDTDTNVRARVCSTMPPRKCSIPDAAMQVGEGQTLPILIIVIVSVCGGVLVLFIILVILLRRKRITCHGTTPPTPPPKRIRQSNTNDDNDTGRIIGDRRSNTTSPVVSYVNPAIDDEESYIEPMEVTNSSSALNLIRFSQDGYVLPNYTHTDRVAADAVVYDNTRNVTAGAVSRPPKTTPRIYDEVAPDPEVQNDQREATTSMSSAPDVIPNTPSKIALKPPPKRTAGKASTAKPIVPVKPAQTRLSSTLTPVRPAPTLPPGMNQGKPMAQSPQQSHEHGEETIQSKLAKALEKRNRLDQE
ncbi:uncharacterized protein [Amphiura filiformis]|uniref:uncharacterized protein isoform X2 n=1 Tax=Amphiura filiformis TaxID=82378 RepID=UPI003B2282CA